MATTFPTNYNTRPNPNQFPGMPAAGAPLGNPSTPGLGPSSPPNTLPTSGSPRNSSQNFIQNQTNAFNNQQGPAANAAATNYANAAATDMAARNNIMQGYSQFGSGGATPNNANTSTAGLNTRLPGESSYDWTLRVANATGRSDIANDPAALNYWASSINSKPQSSDMGYWIDKFTGGGGGGTGGQFGSYSAFTGSPMFASLYQAGPAERANAQYAGTERAAAARQLDMSMFGPGGIYNVKPSDPFNSYAGYTEFSNTGGYSPADLANMRARGVAPIRAAYANAERNVGQQRALQGGYSPNAIAAQVKMAREQGQGMADASTNLEAQLAQMKQQGRLQGLGGMSDIEKQKLQAQMQADIFNAGQGMQGNEFNISNEMDINKFNAGQGNQVGMFNAGQGNEVGMFNAGQANQIGMFNAGQGNQVGMFNAGQGNNMTQFNAGQMTQAQQNQINDQYRALQGMTQLYGTTPGMTNMFGDQLTNLINSRGSFGASAMNAWNQANQLPDAYQQDLARINATGNTIAAGANAFGTAWDAWNNRTQQNPYQWQGPTQPTQPQYNFPQPTPYTGGPTYGGSYPPSIISAPPPPVQSQYYAPQGVPQPYQYASNSAFNPNMRSPNSYFRSSRSSF